jgi:hypothetical protein
MNVDIDLRRTLTRGLGVVGALAGSTAVVAATTSGGVAAAQPGQGDAPTATGATGATPTAAPGTYQSCTALFGLTQKGTASWVMYDVVENRPVTPPVTIGGDLQAIVTVHGGVGQADVECEADVPAWTTGSQWLDFVAQQRAPSVPRAGAYPYPGGPGYAIPGVGTTYTPNGAVNLLTDAITVSGASVRFLESSPAFSIVSGSPQVLTNLSWAAGSDDALQQVLAIDPGFSDTVDQCGTTPGAVDPAALTAAVAALGEVWGVDVDALFPPASPSVTDRCLALGDAQAYFFATATRSLSVGATATVTVEPPPPPTTSTSTTSTSTTQPAAVAADQVVPSFTG